MLQSSELRLVTSGDVNFGFAVLGFRVYVFKFSRILE